MIKIEDIEKARGLHSKLKESIKELIELQAKFINSLNTINSCNIVSSTISFTEGQYSKITGRSRIGTKEMEEEVLSILIEIKRKYSIIVEIIDELLFIINK